MTKKLQPAMPSLFDQTSPSPDKTVRLAATARRREPRFHAIPNPEAVRREVLALARARQEQGIWADHVEEIAVRLGLSPADIDRKNQRMNSWSGPFLRSLAAEGVICQLRRSDGSKVQVRSVRDRAKGNPQTVYTVPAAYDRALADFTQPRMTRS